MKTYVIKDIIYNLETEERHVYYTGTDGYVHDSPEFAEGYKVKGMALRKINKEINYFKKIDDTHCLEGKNWVHSYSIVELESK